MKKLKREEIKNIVDLHESMRNSYFFNPPNSANARRRYEKEHSINLKGIFYGKELDLNCDTSCSCKNVYYKGCFYVNGEKVTIRKIKNMLSKKEMYKKIIKEVIK